MKNKAIYSLFLFIILFLGNKLLPLQWAFTSPSSVEYYSLTMLLLVLFIMELIVIIWMLSFLFKNRRSFLFILFAVIIGIADVLINLKVQKMRVDSHLWEYGTVTKATVNFVEKRRGRVYYRLYYEYGDEKYLTLSAQIYNKNIADNINQGDSVVILVSETYPEIYDIISFGVYNTQ